MVLMASAPAGDPPQAESSWSAPEQPVQGKGRAGHENEYREVDGAEVAKGVEVVRVVRRQRHRKPEYRCGDRAHPCPQLAAPDPVADEEQHRQPGGGDEAG